MTAWDGFLLGTLFGGFAISVAAPWLGRCLGHWLTRRFGDQP
jgi:hypothetical protein